MSDPQTRFEHLAEELIVTQQVSQGKWFGLPALKINGKIFAAQWTNGDLIVKLQGEHHQNALALEGAVLFQPLPDRNPMREWVQIPAKYSEQWFEFSIAGLTYVRSVNK